MATTISVNPAVRSRDSESAREFHAEEAELEHQQQQAAEERAAAEQAQRAEGVRQKQRAFIAESVAQNVDPLFQIDPQTVAGRISVPVADVPKWNDEQVRIFLNTTPEYLTYKSDATAQTIIEYIERNAKLVLVSATQLRWAFERLKSLGLIHPNSAPVSELEKRTAPIEVNHSVSPSNGSPDELVDGWTLDGLSRRQWTRRELDRLGADDYRRALKLGALSVARHLGKPGADRVLIAAGKELL